MDIPLSLFDLLFTCFVVSIVCYLVCYKRRLMFGSIVILFLMITGQFIFFGSHSLDSWMGYIKLICELVFGLGAVIGFSLLSRRLQVSYLSAFTLFVNIAVLGNIAMMIVIPSEGTYRGLTSKVTCILLVVWLIQEIIKNRWRTTQYQNGFFLFNSVPLAWIFSHCIYRIGLITLPIFDSYRYILLEPISLVLMYVFYRIHKAGHPVRFYFGLADTVAVSTLAIAEQFLGWLAPLRMPASEVIHFSQNQLDMMVVPIQMGVAVFALRAIVNNLRHSPVSLSLKHQ